MKDRRVVIVEDERHIAHFLAFYLEQAGYVPEVLYDGRGLVELLDRIEPVAMLLDLGLPGCSGRELCRQIRGSKRWQDLILFVVSGEDFGTVAKARGVLGASAIFRKPCSIAEIVKTLNHHVVAESDPGLASMAPPSLDGRRALQATSAAARERT